MKIEEAVVNNPKNKIMKMIETFKEDMKHSLKEIERNKQKLGRNQSINHLKKTFKIKHTVEGNGLSLQNFKKS